MKGNVMKRIASLLLLLSYLFTLASCSAEDETSGTTDDTNEHVCEFNIESPKPKYLKTRSTCTKRGEYYYSCACGEMGTESFEYGALAGHDFYLQSAVEKYLFKEATVKTAAVYYKTCKCGEIGTETFTYGSPITLNETQKAHLPTSLTVTLFDAQDYTYGFTYNTDSAPIDPVIQIREASATEWVEYVPTWYETTTYDNDENLIPSFVSKTVIALQPDTTYVYRVWDKGADVVTPEGTVKTKNSSAETFTFAHVSDSQAGAAEFGWVMKAVSDNADFVLHTGDVVQYANYEHEWDEMLDGNYQYVMGMPIMPISGNHETSYNYATYETEKHFNNQLPTQTSTALGYYYSFVYGDAKFIMLNTNDLEDNRLKAEQYDWLISELQNNGCKWTIVSLHNPMYSVGKYGADETRNAIALALRDQLAGVFAEYGVDLVLQGHDHAVSRTYPIDADGVPSVETKETVSGTEYIVDPNGVIYLMNGPAGTQSRAPVEVDEALYAHAETGKKASWAEITVSADTITVTVKYHTGSVEKVYYSFGIKK